MLKRQNKPDDKEAARCCALLKETSAFGFGRARTLARGTCLVRCWLVAGQISLEKAREPRFTLPQSRS
jgi:hypothetical protein